MKNLGLAEEGVGWALDEHNAELITEEMKLAAEWLWFELGIAADLSGAASIAALMSGKFRAAADSHVCALICGAGPDGIKA